MKKDGFTFDGFEPANTTPVPDVLFDVLLPYLNEAQLKVMLYIIRRTLGFKKTSDAISLRQFRFGITTKFGEQLDRGCGLNSFTTIIKALTALEHMGCIHSEKRESVEGDQATTVFRIRFRGTAQSGAPTAQSGAGVLRKVEDGAPLSGAGVLRKVEQQETVLQETDSQETVLQESIRAEHHELGKKVEEKIHDTDTHLKAVSSDSHKAIRNDVKPPTDKEIKQQQEQRAKEIWVLIEKALETSFSASQRRAAKNARGMERLLEDEITDETLEFALSKLDQWQITNFTVEAFYEKLPGLLAKHRPSPNSNKPAQQPYTVDEERNKRNIEAMKARVAAKGGLPSHG